MFNLVGRVVIYGFCLYGMLRMFEYFQASDAEERPSVKPQHSEELSDIEGPVTGMNVHPSHPA
jgi:hypothetical protein